MLPFTAEQFFAVFAAYNIAVWPVQILAYALGLGMLIVLWTSRRSAPQVVGLGLAAMWVWTGVAYHGVFFAEINKAALGFGTMFVVQGAFFVGTALRDGSLRFEGTEALQRRLGWAFTWYSAVLYPLIGVWTGHHYPGLPMFGIAPCPVVLFTFGVLLLARAPLPRHLLVIPFVWALIGGTAAFLLGVAQDWLLLASAGVGVYLFVRDQPRPRAAAI